jgi:hypothetical protein
MKQRGKLALLAWAMAIGVLLAMVAPASANSTPRYTLGCIPSPKETLQNHYNAGAVKRLSVASPAASVDWSPGMPVPGDQGTQGSCVGWSAAYYKTYQEGLEHGWDLGSSSHQFSPAYIYNQIDDGQDNGATIADALNLLVKQGDDTLSDFPYNQSDCSTQPTRAQQQRAADFKEQSWTPVFQGSPDINAMKAALANGPIEAGTNVYMVAGWETGEINQHDVPVGGSPDGGHAIALVGYDDSHQTKDGSGAFKFINSWGANWGYGGYGWISYAYAQKNFFEAEAMYDKNGDPDTYAVSGKVTGQNQQPVAGVAISFTKQAGTDPVPAAVTTDANGAWSQSGFEEGTPYQATAGKARESFTPASVSFDDTQSHVINFTAGASVPVSTLQPD